MLSNVTQATHTHLHTHKGDRPTTSTQPRNTRNFPPHHQNPRGRRGERAIGPLGQVYKAPGRAAPGRPHCAVAADGHNHTARRTTNSGRQPPALVGRFPQSNDATDPLKTHEALRTVERQPPRPQRTVYLSKIVAPATRGLKRHRDRRPNNGTWLSSPAG